MIPAPVTLDYPRSEPLFNVGAFSLLKLFEVQLFQSHVTYRSH